MATKITDEQFIEAIHEVVNGNEDFVYTRASINGRSRCAYFDEKGSPSCIVGQAIYRCGVTLDDIEPTANVGSSAAAVLPALGISSEVTAAALEAQGMQDNGEPWGEALKEFNDFLIMADYFG